MRQALDLFSPPVRDWFRAAFAEPTVVQERGWQEVAAGRHVLMAAPTGSGKTLAAFLWCLDRLTTEPIPAEAERCRVLYVSPLKALAHDVDRNLRSPLVGIRHQIEANGQRPPDISVAIRTGDTPTDIRRSMERHPPDILITTPESLFLILTSAARKILTPVRWLIVDEIHSVASTKRGSHLALSLERLCQLTKLEPQRIGLSATQRPLEEVGKFLGGADREVAIVDAGRLKTMEVRVEVPVEDMTRLTAEDEDGAKGGNSIWPAIYPRLLQLIREHRSTIVFVNSRRLAERIAARINELAEEDLVRAHHGSIAREQRLLIEDELKPRRRSSWASTWELSTSCCRSKHRPAWPRAFSVWAARGTPWARSRAAWSSRSFEATCWSRPPSSRACWMVASSRQSFRASRSTCWPSRSLRCAPWTSGTRKSSDVWFVAPTHTATLVHALLNLCSTCSAAGIHLTSSRSCALASSGTASPARCAAAPARSDSR
jgi:Lhr-like helicase